jgi:hypothetical protein
MKKALLVAAASLFVIGQALAQGQPAPSDKRSGQPTAQQPQNNAGQQTKGQQSNQKATDGKGKADHAMSHKGGHRMAHRARHHRVAHRGHHHRMAMSSQQGQQMQMGYRGPQKLTCRKGQKPDGITCM